MDKGYLIVLGVSIFVAFLIVVVPHWTANRFYKSTNQTPELPFTIYWPKYDLAIGIILGLALCGLSYFVNYKWIPTMMMAVGLFLACCCAIELHRGIKLVEISTDGVRAHIAGSCRAKQFISWQEIQSIEAFEVTTKGNVINYIEFQLLNGKTASFICHLRGNAKKDLLNWLQEYLSRYGGGDRQSKINKG